MFLKELCEAIGLKLEVYNLIIDYKLKDGTCYHVAHQAVSQGVNVTDDLLIEFVKNGLPEGSRVCTIFEIKGDYELQELSDLCISEDYANIGKRCIYVDGELMREYFNDILYR